MATEVVHLFDVADYDAAVGHAAQLLRDGQLVVLPTETVYGAAGLLTHTTARERLQQLRGGEASKPFILHLAHRDDALQYLGAVNEFARCLMKKLWPGPVGLMFDVPADRRAEVCGKLGVAEEALYEAGAIVLRCPDHLVATDVLTLADGPVVVTRAGESTHRPDELAKELDGRVDLVLDAGPPQHSKPSTLLKVAGESYEIVRAGVYDQRIIERLLRTTVLFVCSGNTCRSPMAEAIAKRLIAEKLRVSDTDLEKKGVSVISAGSFAMPGSRATPAAAEAVKEIGADLTAHRSRPLTVELIHQADLIFTMGRSHASAVASLVPSALEKTQTLDPAGDIDDPIGGDLRLYQSLAQTMQKLIAQRLAEKKDLLP